MNRVSVRRGRAALMFFFFGLLTTATVNAAEVCPSTLSANIPARRATAPGGAEFAGLVAADDSQQRERAIENTLLAGDLPRFLRWLKPVKLRAELADGREVTATICVMPDYLAIGSNRDFLRIPMDLHTAAAVAARFGFTLPTRKMVDAIYRQSTVHLTPQPMPAGPRMRSTDYYVRHNRSITAQLTGLDVPLGTLISGDKKDVVISNRLATRPGRIAIYGWYKPNGRPIQPLSTVHGANYADYSHGIRLVADTMYLDGKPTSIRKVLGNPRLAMLLSDEGPIKTRVLIR